jgi:hypothetical protein
MVKVYAKYKKHLPCLRFNCRWTPDKNREHYALYAGCPLPLHNIDPHNLLIPPPNSGLATLIVMLCGTHKYKPCSGRNDCCILSAFMHNAFMLYAQLSGVYHLPVNTVICLELGHNYIYN